MTPALQAIRQAIQDQITTNHNGEITGAILNPILVGMITALVDSIGDIEHLNTANKDDLVSAVNELYALIQTIEPVKKFTGVGDPNLNPPTGATLGDLYYQMYGGVVVDVWQFIEIRWVSLNTSRFMVKDGSNEITDDFEIKHGPEKLKVYDGLTYGNGYSLIEIMNADGYIVTYTDYDGRSFQIELNGLRGNDQNNVKWELIKEVSDTEDSYLRLPQTGSTPRRLAVSVNGEYADENGNIEIEVDENAVTYDLQDPTLEQQANARENIGVTTSLYKQSFLNFQQEFNTTQEFTLDFVPSQVVSLVINRDKILHSELDDYEIQGNLLTIQENLEERDNIFITYYH